MADGTITITNIGVFGMDVGTPILNPGEAGIIAMGTIKSEAVGYRWRGAPGMVTTVRGSFDHRIVDGDKITASSPTSHRCAGGAGAAARLAGHRSAVPMARPGGDGLRAAPIAHS